MPPSSRASAARRAGADSVRIEARREQVRQARAMAKLLTSTWAM